MAESNQQGNRVSTPDWKSAVDLADKALEEAKNAFALHEAGLSTESQDAAETAIQHLADRYDLASPLLRYSSVTLTYGLFLHAALISPLSTSSIFSLG